MKKKYFWVPNTQPKFYFSDMEHSIPPDLKDQLQKQKWFHGEFKTQLKRLEKLNKITFDLSKNNLITLSSPILTPELKAIATSMFIPNVSKIAPVNLKTWSIPNSNSHSIACSVGGWGAVESVIQLPTKSKRPDSTIIFSSVAARKSAQYHIKANFGKKAPNIQYSLNNFPKLKFQVRCLNNIFKELIAEKLIKSYNLNNFAACNHNEFLFPLYSFKIEGNHISSKFNDSKCISLYKDGFSVPTNDFMFQSKEYQELKTTIQNHVFDSIELTRSPSNPTLKDHINFICPEANLERTQASPMENVSAPPPPTESAPPTEAFPPLPSTSSAQPLSPSTQQQIPSWSGIKEFNKCDNYSKTNSNHKAKTYLVYKSDYEFQSPIDLQSLMSSMSPMIGPEVVKICSPNLFTNSANSPNKSMTNLVPARLDFSN